METLKLTLSVLNEQVAEAAEPKPTPAEHPGKLMCGYSAKGYWMLTNRPDWTEGGTWHSWWVPRYQFVEDVGAIQGLIAEYNENPEKPECEVLTGFDGTGIEVCAWHGHGADFQMYERRLLKFKQFAPALCCAFMFALDGIRRDVEEGEE